MKKQKVCALLCVVALSTASVTPVMAADSIADAQISTESSEVTAEEQTDVGAEVGEEQYANITGESDALSQEEQNEGTEQDVENEEVLNEQELESTVTKEETDSNADGEEETVPTDGLYEDEDGNWYYYENGEMITNTIIEIEDENGTYGYYFNDEGVMLRSSQTWVSYWDEEKDVWIDGNILADDAGHLYKGWNANTYFGDDYFQYYSRILDENGVLYYFNESGELLVNQEIIVDNVLYKADEKGVLTVQDTAGKTGWQKSGDDWYYYKDGKALKNTFEEIKGIQYYFYSDGTMATGVFWVEDFIYWAEPSGKIVKTKGWYHSTETNKWYWFDENRELVTNSLIDINGKQYYLAGNGEMQTGVFEANYQDENGEWISKRLFADTSGVISASTGWKQINGYWYYVKSDGTSASDEIIKVKDKLYYIDYNGKMLTGRISIYTSGEYKQYITDNSGAIVTNNWVKDQMNWYYADKEGNILKNQWIDGKYYVTADGSMAIGKTEIGDKTYIFDENGRKELILEEQKDGWYLADGDWYYVKDGELSTGWLDYKGNKFYLEDGKMLTNQLVPAEHLEDRYSYVGQDGVIKSGWAQKWNIWMYFEKDKNTGNIVAFENGWKKINGTWYYFNDTDMVANDIIEIDGRLSKFSASGAWEGYVDNKGWKQISSGGWYYVNEDGSLNLEEKKTINGKTYYFWNGGLMMQNTTYYDQGTGSRYWINNDGKIDTSTGWKKNKWNDWYYVENGKIVTGDKTINGVTYTFDGGYMLANTVRYDSRSDKYLLYDGNGRKVDVSKTGWYKVTEDGKTFWYYFQNGQPYNGKLGNYYIQFGHLITGIYSTINSMYLFDDNGILQTSGWKLYDGNWYYAGSTGRLYTGERTISGKKYWFDYSGKWIR